MTALAAAVGIVLALAPLYAQDPTRLRFARIALEGPLSEATLRLPGGSATRIEIALARGERRALEVPVAPPTSVPAFTPAVTVVGDGQARWEGWNTPDSEGWDQVLMGLRMRPLPPALEGASGGPAGRPPLGALLLAAGGFVLALRWRARPVAALACGVVGATSVLLAAAPAGSEGRVLRLIEGDAESDRWISVLALRERHACVPDLGLRLMTVPTDAALEVRVTFDPNPRWSFEAPHATLYQLELIRGLREDLRREGGHLRLPLTRTWVRDPDGTWSARGPWPLGASLPPARPQGAEPPGWISPALSPGRGILIGHCAPGAELPPTSVPPDETWVRVLGF